MEILSNRQNIEQYLISLLQANAHRLRFASELLHCTHCTKKVKIKSIDEECPL